MRVLLLVGNWEYQCNPFVYKYKIEKQEKFVTHLSAAVDENKGTCDCNQELAIALGTSWLIASESSSASVAQIQLHSCIIAGCIRESMGAVSVHSPKVPRAEPTDHWIKTIPTISLCAACICYHYLWRACCLRSLLLCAGVVAALIVITSCNSIGLRQSSNYHLARVALRNNRALQP
jgi:hypothetical protein